MAKLVEFRYLKSDQHKFEEKAEKMGVDPSIFNENVKHEWLEKIANTSHISDISPILLHFDDCSVFCVVLNIGGIEYVTDIPYNDFVELWEDEFGRVITYISDNQGDDDKES